MSLQIDQSMFAKILLTSPTKNQVKMLTKILYSVCFFTFISADTGQIFFYFHITAVLPETNFFKSWIVICACHHFHFADFRFAADSICDLDRRKIVSKCDEFFIFLFEIRSMGGENLPEFLDMQANEQEI